MKLRTILVGVDGSADSMRAVQWAAGLAEQTDAKVVAVHAVGLLESLGENDAVSPPQHHHDIEEAFEKIWCAPLDAVRNSRHILFGSPVPLLLAVAEQVEADLIVVGSRGVGGFPQLLLGSTSMQLAHHSKRPVTVVPNERIGIGVPTTGAHAALTL